MVFSQYIDVLGDHWVYRFTAASSWGHNVFFGYHSDYMRKSMNPQACGCDYLVQAVILDTHVL